MKQREADFYERLEGGGACCVLCPHGCRIAPGGKGHCGARRNENGVLLASSYAKVTSVSLDPIEKKPLARFYPGAMILSLGGYGCNFHCDFCQNHAISMQEADWRLLPPKEVAEMAAELTLRGNIGVAYTYNEPLIGYEYVLDCARLVAGQGGKNALVTNGFICREPLEKLLAYIDAMNIDLKSFQPSFYKDIGGRLDDVLRTIETAAARCHVEVTTLIIPGKNDSTEEMEALSRWLAGVSPGIQLHISRFFPRYKMKDAAPTPPDTIYRLAEVARRSLRYVYTGNC